MQRFISILLLSFLAWSATPAWAETSQLDFAPHKGKVVYIDFWASWCIPCLQSFPWMQAMHEKYSKQGLVIIAINLDHDRAKADAFLKKFKPTFTQMFDPKGKLAEEYKVLSMPYSFLVDRSGTPRLEHIGFFKSKISSYEKEIVDLLNEPALTHAPASKK